LDYLYDFFYYLNNTFNFHFSNQIYLTLFIVVISLFILNKLTKFFYIISFLTLLGTFAHESMHFIFSFLTNGRPVSFSIFPKKIEAPDGKSYQIIFGSVSSSNIRWYNAWIISLSPLFLFYFSYLLLLQMNTSNVPLYSYEYFGYIFVIANFIYSGLPSTTDLKVAFRFSYIPIFIFFSIYYFLYVNNELFYHFLSLLNV